jgi:hypothetical protein
VRCALQGPEGRAEEEARYVVRQLAAGRRAPPPASQSPSPPWRSPTHRPAAQARARGGPGREAAGRQGVFRALKGFPTGGDVLPLPRVQHRASGRESAAVFVHAGPGLARHAPDVLPDGARLRALFPALHCLTHTAHRTQDAGRALGTSELKAAAAAAAEGKGKRSSSEVRLPILGFAPSGLPRR